MINWICLCPKVLSQNEKVTFLKEAYRSVGVCRKPKVYNLVSENIIAERKLSKYEFLTKNKISREFFIGFGGNCH